MMVMMPLLFRFILRVAVLVFDVAGRHVAGIRRVDVFVMGVFVVILEIENDVDGEVRHGLQYVFSDFIFKNFVFLRGADYNLHVPGSLFDPSVE